MSVNILVVYYSAYGHTFQLAKSVMQGAKKGEDTEVKICKVPEIPMAEEELSGQEAYQNAKEKQSDIPEVVLEDLRWADGICFGTPTRFGNMASQLKQFIDTAGGLWNEGALEDKPAGVFVSTATIHGGQESTILSMMIPLMHFGMIIVGTPYGQNPQIRTIEGVGGTPYGPSTMADIDGSRQPVEEELKTARNLGRRVAKAAKRLKPMRKS